MGKLVLSERDLSLIRGCTRALLSPLEFEHPNAWRTAVNRSLKRLFGADMATFQLPHPDIEFLLSDETDQSELDKYLPLLAELDTKLSGSLPKTAALQVCNRAMLWGDEIDELYASTYYHEFIVPNRAHDMLCASTPSSESELPAMVYLHHESPSGRRFGERGVQLLRLLYPAFQAGVLAFERFHRLRGALLGVVDEVDQAAWVFDADGTLLHRNPRAEAMSGGDIETVRLEAAAGDLAVGLGALATRDGRGESPRSCRRRVWLGSSAVMLEGSLLDGMGDLARPAALVSVRSPEGSKELPAGIHAREATAFDASEQFGFTPRQREVALLLAHRLTNREIAERLRISEHTARRHTERVLARLGVHSRREVAAKLDFSATDSNEQANP